MDRRDFCQRTLLVGASAALGDFFTSSIARGQTTLNQEVLNNIQASLGTPLAKLAGGIATKGDYQSMAAQVGSLIAELQSVNFDTAIEGRCTTVLNNPGDTDDVVADANPSYLATLAQNAIAPYAPDYPLANLQKAFSSLPQFTIPPGLPPFMQQSWVANNVKGCIQKISQDGAIAYLSQAQSYISAMPEESSFCADIGLVLAMLAIIALILLLGCSPLDPLLVVICPAMGVLTVIAAILTIIYLIVCSF